MTKIRSITVGVHLEGSDFQSATGGEDQLQKKLNEVRKQINSIESALTSESYEVQTVRVSFNAFEEWLGVDDSQDLSFEFINECIEKISHLDEELTAVDIKFCSLGGCRTANGMKLLPQILAVSDRLFCSFQFQMTDKDDVVPDAALIEAAAKSTLEIFRLSGTMGCFRHCAAFNCRPNNPFFPVAYHQGQQSCVSIALESADLLFIAFFGAESISEGSRNLTDVMRQTLLPIQNIVSPLCEQLGLVYGGIDASINPGLTLPDSIGAGIESLLQLTKRNEYNNNASSGSGNAKSLQPGEPVRFGDLGTLAVVSAVTKAIKRLQLPPDNEPNNGDNNNKVIQLAGYSGLMLPVMEDLILAERAASPTPTFGLRDLLVFSSVCGVGLDTVPVPGDTTAEEIARVYTEIAALAFRLDKPLSGRLLLMEGKIAGEHTELTSPYTCDTRVFSVCT